MPRCLVDALGCLPYAGVSETPRGVCHTGGRLADARERMADTWAYGRHLERSVPTCCRPSLVCRRGGRRVHVVLRYAHLLDTLRDRCDQALLLQVLCLTLRDRVAARERESVWSCLQALHAFRCAAPPVLCASCSTSSRRPGRSNKTRTWHVAGLRQGASAAQSCTLSALCRVLCLSLVRVCMCAVPCE